MTDTELNVIAALAQIGLIRMPKTIIVERQKARHTLRLEHLFAEAIQAWEHSKTDTTRRRQRKTQSGRGDAGATVAEIVTENQHGDPRYLDEARKALADHRKLWGLDAPHKLDVRASRNPYDGMTEDALRGELARQARLLVGPETPPTGSPSPEGPNITIQETPDADH